MIRIVNEKNLGKHAPDLEMKRCKYHDTKWYAFPMWCEPSSQSLSDGFHESELIRYMSWLYIQF